MVGAFGTPGGTQGRRWRPEDLLETHLRLAPGGIPRGVTAVTIGAQVVQVDHEWTFGGRRMRPKFRCPQCGRGCKYLYGLADKYTCRLCSNCDYSSRHVARYCPALGRLARLRRKLGAPPWPEPLPPRPRYNTAQYDRLLPLILAAEGEVRASLLRTLGDLARRACRARRSLR
jgi:hypothetical protein